MGRPICFVASASSLLLLRRSMSAIRPVFSPLLLPPTHPPSPPPFNTTQATTAWKRSAW